MVLRKKGVIHNAKSKQKYLKKKPGLQHNMLQ